MTEATGPLAGAPPAFPSRPAATRRPARGVVVTFNAARGLGTLRTDDGHEVPFHCTAIANGSRRIDTGRRVVCVLGAGRLGLVEAQAISEE